MTPLLKYTYTTKLLNIYLLSRYFSMRRYAFLPLILMFFTIPANLRAQNIFDENHSREFAQYLMQSNNYQMAASEWERVLFFSPKDTVARLNLIKSYRLADRPADGWTKLNAWYPSGPLSRSLSLEAVQLTLRQNDFQSFGSVIGRSAGLAEAEKSTLKLGAWLMEGTWINQPAEKREPSFTVASMDPRLLNLYSQTKNIHRKSPGAAVALSAIVPGMGKIYAHDWKDGLMSLLFVATNAYQSYRGFSKNGIGSATGWIFGTLAAGFYTANLFGSWKSAKIYNTNQTDRIRHEAEGIIITH